VVQFSPKLTPNGINVSANLKAEEQGSWVELNSVSSIEATPTFVVKTE